MGSSKMKVFGFFFVTVILSFPSYSIGSATSDGEPTGGLASMASDSKIGTKAPENECGSSFPRLNSFFRSQYFSELTVAVFRHEMLDGFERAAKAAKLAKEQRESYRLRLQALIDKELPIAIEENGGFLDRVSCWYSEFNPDVDLDQLQDLLDSTKGTPDFGTMPIQGAAMEWCEKKFWPAFYEKFRSQILEGEPVLKFRPTLWCGIRADL